MGGLTFIGCFDCGGGRGCSWAGGTDVLAVRPIVLAVRRYIPLQLVLAAVGVDMFVALLNLHLSFMKVSVAVVAGAAEYILLSSFECC